MLGKVSVQPSVGHWKVLPAKKETGLSQHCAVPLGGDPGAVLIPFHAVFPYPPPGSMSTICAPRGTPILPSPYPQGTAWVCSAPSGGPSALACWEKPICSRNWNRRSASLQEDTAIGLIPCPDSPMGHRDG